MKKIMTIVSLILMSVSLPATAAPQIVKSFADGSTVNCIATHCIGNDGSGYTEYKMDVFYRIDEGQKEAHAYFKKVPKLGNYSFDGSCGREICGLSIRDLRTNTVSDMNAAYAKLNQYSSQIQIMNFEEDLTLTLRCQLIRKSSSRTPL